MHAEKRGNTDGCGINVHIIIRGKQIEETDNLLKTVRNRKLKWFGHVNRQTGTLANDTVQESMGRLKEEKETQEKLA